MLKAAHHGSREANSEELLDLLSGQRAAVISAGVDNRYGHPHQETLERIAQADSRIYSTGRADASPDRDRRSKDEDTRLAGRSRLNCCYGRNYRTILEAGIQEDYGRDRARISSCQKGENSFIIEEL